MQNVGFEIPGSQRFGRNNLICKYLIYALLLVHVFFLQSSWKLSLRNAFKNFRCGSSKENENNSENSAPQAKRIRIMESDETDITEEEYDAVLLLKG